MARRYELPDAGWELIKDLVYPEQKMGRPRSDDRLVLNGIFWILCSEAAWRDMPERFGPWSTVYQRFRDWRDDGTFDRVLERLHVRLNQEGLIDLETWMIDSTAVRATRASSGAGKKGAIDHALRRSGGGLTTKIHLICDANGIPFASCCHRDRPATLHMLTRSWIRFVSPESRDGLVSAADGTGRQRLAG